MELLITEFRGRNNPRGVQKSYTWESLKSRLRHPIVTSETVAEFQQLDGAPKTDCKDRGGFVAGSFIDNYRTKKNVRYRTILVVDVDSARLDDAEAFECLYDIVFFAHTTHSSTEEKPRTRWLFPLTRPVTDSEYRELSRMAQGWIGGDDWDTTTEQPERLMFWPTVSKDGVFHTWEGGTEWLNPTDIFGVEFDEKSMPVEPPLRVELPDEKPFRILEGNRNVGLFTAVSRWRAGGLDSNTIRVMAEAFNTASIVPPLSDEEVESVVRSVCGRYKQGDALRNMIGETLSESFGDIAPVEERPLATTDKAAYRPGKINILEHMETLAELMARDVPPVEYIIDDILPVGLTILAAPPKFGKSWMCLDMGCCVARGEDFFGYHTHKGGVVYLCLEDGDRRIKARTTSMKATGNYPDNLALIYRAPTLKDGLLDSLDLLLAQKPDTKLIYIDTYQKIRDIAGKNEGVYGHDYRETGLLQSYAMDHNIAIVLVHHTNKGGDNTDPLNRLNGSTGIIGAPDGFLILTRSARNSEETELYIDGRDVISNTLVLRFDHMTNRWSCLGEKKDVELTKDDVDFNADPIVNTIRYRLDELESRGITAGSQVVWRCTSAELLSAITNRFGPYENGSVSASGVGARVRKLASRLESKDGITYDYICDGSRREHVFSRELI